MRGRLIRGGGVLGWSGGGGRVKGRMGEESGEESREEKKGDREGNCE